VIRKKNSYSACVLMSDSSVFPGTPNAKARSIVNFGIEFRDAYLHIFDLSNDSFKENHHLIVPFLLSQLLFLLLLLSVCLFPISAFLLFLNPPWLLLLISPALYLRNTKVFLDILNIHFHLWRISQHITANFFARHHDSRVCQRILLASQSGYGVPVC